MDLGVMVKMGDSTLDRTPELEPYNRIQISVFFRTMFDVHEYVIKKDSTYLQKIEEQEILCTKGT